MFVRSLSNSIQNETETSGTAYNKEYTLCKNNLEKSQMERSIPKQAEVSTMPKRREN
jgi:hypothetical protein